MPGKTSAICLTVLLTSIVSASSPSFASTANSAADGQGTNLMAERVKSAQTIIAQSKALETKIQRFHLVAQQQIAEAKKLKGEAQMLRSMPPPLEGTIKLNPLELREAQSQYQGHIDEFKAHASAYQDHLKQFQATLGECHANEAAYQALVNAHSLHVSQFHLTMPSIRPPHVCGAMNMTEDQLRHAMNAMRADASRVALSQSALQLEEIRLRDSRGMSGTLDHKVESAAQRNQAEQDLYAEFGKLRTEYELLKTEKDIIARSTGKGSVGKFTTATVAGKIRH